jgi:putative thioredoxin
MLLGQNQPPQSPAAAAGGPAIFDATIADFEQKVLLASMETPILADFWAPWCGPCKQLTPILEQAVKATGGAVRLAKINIDENQELAQALRIQSVPTVYAFFGGRPIDAFMGAKPAGEIAAFIDKLVKAARQAQPGAMNVPEVLAQAAQALGAGDAMGAQDLYGAILSQDPDNASACAGLVRCMIAMGAAEEAKEFAASVPEAVAKHPDFTAAKTALELTGQTADDGAIKAFEARIAKDANDHAARIDLAVALFAANRKEEAVDMLIESIRRNRTWEEEKARKQLLKFFEALGFADSLAADGRRKLSSVLFS